MKFKTIFKKRFLLAVILSVLLVFSAVVLTVTQIIPNQKFLRQVIEDTLKVERSSADVFIEGNHLNFKFKIVKKETQNFGQFAQNLGVNVSVFENLSIELDKDSLEKISPILPVTLFLEFEPKSVKFSDKSLSPLKSAISKSEFEFATGSGKLVLNAKSAQDFYMKLTDPKPLLEYATASGQINLANKTYAMFPILEKIARMELRVNGRYVSGEVILK